MKPFIKKYFFSNCILLKTPIKPLFIPLLRTSEEHAAINGNENIRGIAESLHFTILTLITAPKQDNKAQ